MTNKKHFPDSAFEKEPLTDRLSRLFRQRQYNPDDVKSIRTSFCISDPQADPDDTIYSYTVSWIMACRNKHGNFHIEKHSNRYETDPMNTFGGYHSYTCLPNEVIDDNCPAKQVLDKIYNAEQELQNNAIKAKPTLDFGPIYMHDSIHLSVAREIFDHACNAEEIGYHVKRTKEAIPAYIVKEGQMPLNPK